jgi:hypothetical protein
MTKPAAVLSEIFEMKTRGISFRLVSHNKKVEGVGRGGGRIGVGSRRGGGGGIEGGGVRRGKRAKVLDTGKIPQFECFPYQFRSIAIVSWHVPNFAK